MTDLEAHIRKALRMNGDLLPRTDEEVEAALGSVDEDKWESEVEWTDPYELFERSDG